MTTSPTALGLIVGTVVYPLSTTDTTALAMLQVAPLTGCVILTIAIGLSHNLSHALDSNTRLLLILLAGSGVKILEFRGRLFVQENFGVC